MRCVRRHHAAVASTRAFRLSAARSPAPASRLVARDRDAMPVGHHPRVVGFDIAESPRSPLPSLGLPPIAQPRRPALASPGAFDAPSKTAPGDPRALSLSGDALAEDVAVAPSASASAGVDWERFAARRLSRHVPVAPDGLVLSDTPRGYRLRVHAVAGVPLRPRTASRRRTRPLARGAVRAVLLRRSHRILPRCDVQQPPRGDETPRRGSCSRKPRKPRRRARGYPGRPARRLLHHRVCGTRCLAVVEIVVVEREGDRVVRETSGGWAAIPTRGADGAEPTGVASVAPVRARIAEVSHVGSTPRGTTPAIRPSGARGCTSTLEPCDAALAVAAAVPDDFPVTYGDVIPGVLRFDARGTLTSAVHAVTTTLVSPLLAPARRVAARVCASPYPPHLPSSSPPRLRPTGPRTTPRTGPRTRLRTRLRPPRAFGRFSRTPRRRRARGGGVAVRLSALLRAQRTPFRRSGGGVRRVDRRRGRRRGIGS